MYKATIFIFAFLIFQTSDCQDQTATEAEEIGTGLETAACVFGCLDSFQRKGVEESAVITTETPAQNSCNGLDLESLLKMCKNYQRAETCLGQCVKSETKKVIISGLDYICVHRLEDFKKHMPCYQEHCLSMEDQCSDRCGALSSATDQWWSQMGTGSSSAASSRRKRQNAAAGDSETTTTASSVDSSSGSGSGDDESSDPILDTCQFVRCYVNCSRPFMEKECGKDAYELLKQTSHILLSFVMSPMEEGWASANISMSEAMATCDGYVSEALTDEKNAAVRPAYVSILTILLSSLALLYRLH